MKKYTIKNKYLNDDILILTLKPKSASDQIRYQAGQYATIGFWGENGRRSPMRSFSIVSSPYTTTELQFAIRISGEYTKALAKQDIGNEIFIRGPFGEFMIDSRYDRNIVMLAGGIGITPNLSIIRAAAETKLSTPITLLYSVKNGYNVPFYDELRELEIKNPKFKMLLFVTNQTAVPNGARILGGPITAERLNQLVAGRYGGITYFICGPKPFMEGIENILITNSVEVTSIISESFTQNKQVYIGDGYNLKKIIYGLSFATMLVGFFGIMLMDLILYVPRVEQSMTTVSSATNPSVSSKSTSYGGSTNLTNANSSSITSSTSNNYQPPVTSIS